MPLKTARAYISSSRDEKTSPRLRPASVASYSARNTSTGSSEAARRAGTYAAHNAQIPSTTETTTSVGKSQDASPNSNPRINVAAITAKTSPAPMPTAVNQLASLRMSRYTDPRGAPRSLAKTGVEPVISPTPYHSTSPEDDTLLFFATGEARIDHQPRDALPTVAFFFLLHPSFRWKR
jgi:hypothetical protein